MAAEHVSKESQDFHLFPWLPKELRDAIWRQCLPHRVVEVDIPLGYIAMGVWLLPDRDRDANEAIEFWNRKVRHVDKKGRGCYMESTTRINSAPPIITRVCYESRMVAFKTGRLLKHEHKQLRDEPDITPHVDYQWFDPARDAVHLHYTMHVLPHRVRVQGNPIRLLHERAAAQGVQASLTYSHMVCSNHQGTEWSRSMALIKDLGEISVCLKNVCIHIDEAPAVHSGLFGTLGEERVLLVDALDHERINKFRTLWMAHRSCRDPLTEAFFEQYVDDESAIIREGGSQATVQEAIGGIQLEWLLCRWEQEAETQRPAAKNVWEAGLLAYSDPGFVPPSSCHPWLKETYLQMPEFRPTIMFRLCTNDCMQSSIGS